MYTCNNVFVSQIILSVVNDFLRSFLRINVSKSIIDIVGILLDLKHFLKLYPLKYILENFQKLFGKLFAIKCSTNLVES